MDRTPQDKARGLQVPVLADYARILDAAEGRRVAFEYVERFAFYERARRAFAVVATGETALYANIILKKGVLAS